MGRMRDESTPKLMCIGPMARRLGVPVRWLRAEADAGRIPHLRAENVLLFDPNAVERELRKRAAGVFSQKGAAR